jgi:predicted O-methyltransferase YrrM
MAISTSVRSAINTILKPLRLQVSTTLLEEQEAARLRALQASGHWRVPPYDQAIALDEARHMAFLAEICSGCKDGYTAFAQEPDGAGDGYYLQNDWFGPIDAEVLYSVVRHFRPQKIIEVGSGFSTRIIRKAIGDGGLSTKVTCIDPCPRASIQAYADEYIASPVEALPPSRIVEQLGENDILFIDSSHKVVPGGDVPFLFLEILPRLRRNVLVHVHDIFFPFEYPEKMIVDAGWEWCEQYLAHAFLAYNQAFDLLWPANYMWTRREREIRAHIPVSSLKAPPSSLWLRKIQD